MWLPSLRDDAVGIGQAEEGDGFAEINPDVPAGFHFGGGTKGAIARFADEIFFADGAFVRADQIKAAFGTIPNVV